MSATTAAAEQSKPDTHVSYDDIPYPSFPFAQTHPDRMATVAKLFGMPFVPTDKCRVLEIGCASGGNLMPMAAALPNSHFVGIDYSQAQIEEGVAHVAAAGLKNIELLHRNVLECGEELGKFDYILSHGVFSWVPKEVQRKMLEVCCRNLTPHGIVYLSYNTYPGWHMKGTIRDMMLFHAAKFPDPKTRIAQSRALLDFLSQAVPAENNLYGTLLKTELDFIRKQSDSYIFHEYLESFNDPMYFHQFVEMAAQAGLQYVGESELSAMFGGHFSPEVQKTLSQVGHDVLQMEQYMDFLRNRTFRQTLLCHKGTNISRHLEPSLLEDLYIACNYKPKNDKIDFRAAQNEEFVGKNNATVGTSNATLKAALWKLHSIFPQSIKFPELYAITQEMINQGASEPMQGDKNVLGADLLKCFVSGVVELSCAPSYCTTNIGERPRTTSLLRYQAGRQNLVSSLRHETIQLDEFDRALIQGLDGERDRRGLVDTLARPVELGQLNMPKLPGIAEGGLKLRLAATIDQTLRKLASLALIQAEV
ncbi:MAG TPA: methyltransferase regulatory domain-containing protein [Planctomycetaceae bacterium]|nr:methyltransferase regulatory domain-containing protein [Planctomycetaceae bacterium]